MADCQNRQQDTLLLLSPTNMPKKEMSLDQMQPLSSARCHDPTPIKSGEHLLQKCSPPSPLSFSRIFFHAAAQVATVSISCISTTTMASTRQARPFSLNFHLTKKAPKSAPLSPRKQITARNLKEYLYAYTLPHLPISDAGDVPDMPEPGKKAHRNFIEVQFDEERVLKSIFRIKSGYLTVRIQECTTILYSLIVY
jgi:hypothetical protein